MVIGLGSGSTAEFAIRSIGESVKRGLRIKAVASSLKSEKLARDLSIPLVSFTAIKSIDITIDGADEIDPNKNLVKGGGGSLLREKILAYNSQLLYIIGDESKLVNTLGKFPLAIEIIPFACELTLKHLELLKCRPVIREKAGQTFTTDNSNLIADCNFGQINEPLKLHAELKSIPGVVETGLFPGTWVTNVYIGRNDGSTQIL